MWNPNSMSVEEDDSWEVKAFAEDTRNEMGTTWPPRSYTCTFCRREFRSAQALGGHMNVHRRDRARLHQTQLNLKNPNSTLLVPTDHHELVANNGLCLLFSLPNPNAIFKPSSLPHPSNTSNLNMSYHSPVVDPHRFSYSVSNSSNNEASGSMDHGSVDTNKKKKTDLAVEGVDLELRLGCSSSGS